MKLRKDAVTSIIYLLHVIHYLLLLCCHCHSCVCDLELQLHRAVFQYSEILQLLLVCLMTSKDYTFSTFLFTRVVRCLIYVGYDSMTGVFLTLSQPDLLTNCNMPLSTASQQENSKLKVGPFLRKEENVCLARATFREQYKPL